MSAFADEASRFCSWLESTAPPDALTISTRIACLYSKALEQPDVDVEGVPGGLEAPTIPEDALSALRSTLAGLPFRYYWELFHSTTDEPDEPVCGDLADDLLDIYKDVKEGLLSFQSGKDVLAAYHWRTHFGFHWSRHAVGALKALADYDPPCG